MLRQRVRNLMRIVVERARAGNDTGIWDALLAKECLDLGLVMTIGREGHPIRVRPTPLALVLFQMECSHAES